MSDQMFTKDQYKEARARIDVARCNLQEAQELLALMQSVCAHDMVAGGHSHTGTEYICSHCGKVEWQ